MVDLQLSRHRGIVAQHNSAPYILLQECLHRERRYYAKVIRTSFQGLVKIGVGRSVCVNNLPIREDDFEIKHVVANQASFGREI